MDQKAGLSWSAIASSGTKSTSARNFVLDQPQQSAAGKAQDARTNNATQPKRSTSPNHRPQGVAEDEEVYVLTLLTDKAQHDRMTALRQQYFPRHLNKLEAHITLFHALPGSKLTSSILPTIQSVAGQTTPFEFRAQKPFRLKKGIAIAIAKTQGAQETQAIHAALKGPWVKEGFLSQQDAGGCQVHYTIMNKVDDEGEVLRALEEVRGSWKGELGMAEGLGLWRYDRGRWRWERGFMFERAEERPDES